MKGWTTPNYTKYKAESRRRALVREYHELLSKPHRTDADAKRLALLAKRLGY